MGACTMRSTLAPADIVHFQKIPLYNGVNLTRGYGLIAIHTPQEVLTDEEIV